MPEFVDEKKVFSLLELGTSIKRMFDTHYNKRYWVKAEMNKLNLYGRSGHCFPDLVEKKDGQVIAEMRGTLWKGDYQRIDKLFNKVVGEPLGEGIKILMQCTVGYDPKFGLSLRIIDIDVNFTLGDIAREKKETLERLTREDMLFANKQLAMPMLPKRMAVISVETSNGYADFLKVLEQNPFSYRFQHTLFPSLLQGDRAVGTMLRQLEEIRRRQSEFDLVAIIRGGGGDIGLSFLNKYELASVVAGFPIPVVTGIGHATNQTVVEMIAHKDAITPTEMADWLIQRFRTLELALDQKMNSLKVIPQEILFGANESLDITRRILAGESRRLQDSFRYGLGIVEQRLNGQLTWRIAQISERLTATRTAFHHAVSQFGNEQRKDLGGICDTLTNSSQHRLSQAKERIEASARSIHNMSPAQVLKRGYSISRVNGKAISAVRDLKKGTILETEFYEGSSKSTITETSKHE
jgi:exodeoxyribonuclease VII large subunit